MRRLGSGGIVQHFRSTPDGAAADTQHRRAASAVNCQHSAGLPSPDWRRSKMQQIIDAVFVLG